MLQSFDRTDGANAGSDLTPFNGRLYGTAYAGGPKNEGTVFSISPAGAFRVLHNFGLSVTDTGGPLAGLLLYKGAFYGTTFLGNGTIYSITPDGVENVLHSLPAARMVRSPLPD